MGRRVLYHVHITKDCVFVCGVGTAVQECEYESEREGGRTSRAGDTELGGIVLDSLI